MEDPEWSEFHDIVGALPEYGIEPGATALMIIDRQYVDAHREYGIGKKLKEKCLEHLGRYYNFAMVRTTEDILRQITEVSQSLPIPAPSS